MPIVVLIFLLLGGCSYFKRDNKPVAPTVSLEDVQVKRDLYLAEQDKLKDSYGWLPFSCDSLLHNSLAAYAGFGVDIYKAEESVGRWRRHPDFEKCLPGNGSKSTISKDMMRGLLLFLWQQKDFQNIKEIEEYGTANHWVMGEAEDDESYWGRVVMVTLAPQIKDMLKLLSAPTLESVVLTYSDEYGPAVLKRTFEAHLHVINIYMRSLMYGGITDYEKATLIEYAKFQPRNALFSALAAKFTDGNYSNAITLLSDETMFPSTHLPTSSNRCADYLWSKEANDDQDYFPCPDEQNNHPGTDLTFVVKIMEE